MSRLVVFVPPLDGETRGWNELMARLKSEPELADSHWLRGDREERWYSIADPAKLAIKLEARIHQEYEKKKGRFDSVILVGHSLGGLLVRQAYLQASGADPVTRMRNEWATKVTRIILLAAPNRGVDPRRSVLLRMASWMARAVPACRRMLAWHLFRGSEFISNLRIQWIRYFAALGPAAPDVIQVLGTDDNIVTRDDSVDVEQFDCGYYISIPDAGHDDLYCLAKAPDPEGRYQLLRRAFLGEQRQLESRIFNGADQVVFVLHGIRASNHDWVRQTVQTIKDKWPHVQAIGPGYKYFSALKFAIPMTRRKNLRWFQDAYTEALARNPLTRFSFIGHSNGTYLLGESLRTVPGMTFERAALVGSVLPADYDWSERARRGQIKSLRIDGSCYDWPVGWLCSALQGVGMRDIGTGGFVGFTTTVKKDEFFWYAGGHSAPLSDTNLAALAEFAVTGNVVPPTMLGRSVPWFATVGRVLHRLGPVFLVGLVVVVAYLAFVAPLAAIGVLVFLLVLILVLDVI
jgi:pimeloyl-ACP methyl ester carboxylesterase